MPFKFIPPEASEKTKIAAALPINCWKPRWTVKDKIQVISDYIEEIRKKDGDEAAIVAMAEVGRRDLYYLCHEILGYKDMEEPLHDDICDFADVAERERRSTLTLIPRAHFKSTILTIGRCIHWMITVPDVAIGLFSGDMKNARKFATEIKNHCENNEKLKLLYPDVFYDNPRKESSLWTQDEFTVIRSEDGIKKKEGTLKIFGLLQNIPTGDHFDRLIGDDIVDQEIVGSEEQMAKVEDRLQYLIPLQQTPTDPIHFVGTRFHMLDAYSKMLEDKDYMVYLRRVIEDGKVIFPGRFDKPMLDKTRIKIGNYKYFCQYLLNPQDPADKKFKLEWLKFFRPWPAVADSKPYYSYFLMVDPANKQKKESDFTAMLVFAVDYDWNIYLIDGIHDKMNPKERIDAVFRLCKKWKINQIGYETIAFQDTDAFWIKRKQINDNYYFEIIEIAHRKQNKFDYIMSTQPTYEEGKFHLSSSPMLYTRVWESPDDGFARTVDLVELFKRQYDLFPNLAHDDLLDVVAMAVRLMREGRIPRPEERLKQYTSAYKKQQQDDFNIMAH
jgi:phage terminase large subunit-like protein